MYFYVLSRKFVSQGSFRTSWKNPKPQVRLIAKPWYNIRIQKGTWIETQVKRILMVAFGNKEYIEERKLAPRFD